MERNRLDKAQRRPKAGRAVVEYAGPQPRKAVCRFPLPVPK